MTTALCYSPSLELLFPASADFDPLASTGGTQSFAPQSRRFSACHATAAQSGGHLLPFMTSTVCPNVAEDFAIITAFLRAYPGHFVAFPKRENFSTSGKSAPCTERAVCGRGGAQLFGKMRQAAQNCGRSRAWGIRMSPSELDKLKYAYRRSHQVNSRRDPCQLLARYHKINFGFSDNPLN